MFCPQPTAQYGHTDLTTSSASDVRGPRACVRGDCTADPRPRGSVPVACRNIGHSPSQVRSPMQEPPEIGGCCDVVDVAAWARRLDPGLAEADGNRTRLAEMLDHYGVEDRGGHQAP